MHELSLWWVLPAVAGCCLLWLLFRLRRACLRANRIDWGPAWMNLLDGLNRLFCYRYHRLNVLGLRLPRRGPAIVVANHVSGLDPLLLLASARRPLRFLIAREEYERFGLNWLFRAIKCIPVDRERNPEQALRSALRSLREGHVVALFPHGKIHLDTAPRRKIKAGAAQLYHLSEVPLLPLRINGVRGAGSVIGGLVMRSRAKITAYPAIPPASLSRDGLMDYLQQLLDGKLPPPGPAKDRSEGAGLR